MSAEDRRDGLTRGNFRGRVEVSTVMRLVLLVLGIALLAVGCGSADGGGSGAGAPPATSESKSSGGGVVPEGGQVGTEPDPASDGTKPPPIVLVSDAGQQVGVTGSFCVDDPVKGMGTCADGPAPAAEELTVVRPGDRIVFRVEGARAVRDRDCHSRDLSCIGEAQVTTPGCSTPLARIFLERGRETAWRVALEPGDYELQVFAYFEADDGRSGDVSAALGLRVEPDGDRAVVASEPERTGCR
jgi:hypothetical protein